jgi:hypothetical protein
VEMTCYGVTYYYVNQGVYKCRKLLERVLSKSDNSAARDERTSGIEDRARKVSGRRKLMLVNPDVELQNVDKCSGQPYSGLSV